MDRAPLRSMNNTTSDAGKILFFNVSTLCFVIPAGLRHSYLRAIIAFGSLPLTKRQEAPATRCSQDANTFTLPDWHRPIQLTNQTKELNRTVLKISDCVILTTIATTVALNTIVI